MFKNVNKDDLRVTLGTSTCLTEADLRFHFLNNNRKLNEALSQVRMLNCTKSTSK